jgi:hypothetical protein
MRVVADLQMIRGEMAALLPQSSPGEFGRGQSPPRRSQRLPRPSASAPPPRRAIAIVATRTSSEYS